VKTIDEAIKGAKDIIAEWVSEDEKARNSVRAVFRHEAQISSKVIKGKEEEGIKYRDYFDWSEPFKKMLLT
jgi:Transcriptional accessory protein